MKVIAQPLGEDDSWREKVKRERKISRRRHRMERLVQSFSNSPRVRKMKQIGIVVIVVTLVLTMGVLYLNRRSGGKLLQGVFGN